MAFGGFLKLSVVFHEVSISSWGSREVSKKFQENFKEDSGNLRESGIKRVSDGLSDILGMFQ